MGSIWETFPGHTQNMPTDILATLAGRSIHDLSVPLEAGMPVHPSHPPYSMALQRRHGDTSRTGGMSSANELIVMCGHSGTHLDALGHFSSHGVMCGGRIAAEVQTGGRGLRDLGIETVDPVVCRGVLLDVAGAEGVEVLPHDFAVTAEIAQGVARAQGVEIRSGDAVLFRTGLIRQWEDAAFLDFDGGQPGITVDCAEWLTANDVFMAGADTMAFEQIVEGTDALPVHPYLLVEQGIYILENADLESIATAGLYEFLYVMTPLKFVGATASPVRPLAIA